MQLKSPSPFHFLNTCFDLLTQQICSCLWEREVHKMFWLTAIVFSTRSIRSVLIHKAEFKRSQVGRVKSYQVQLLSVQLKWSFGYITHVSLAPCNLTQLNSISLATQKVIRWILVSRRVLSLNQTQNGFLEDRVLQALVMLRTLPKYPNYPKSM